MRTSRDILDSDTLGRAYHTSLNSDYIEPAGICLLDLEDDALKAYCRSLKACITKHLDRPLRVPNFWDSFLLPPVKSWATKGHSELLSHDTSAQFFSYVPIDRPSSLSYFPPPSTWNKKLTERVTKLLVADLVFATRMNSRDSDLTRWILHQYFPKNLSA